MAKGQIAWKLTKERIGKLKEAFAIDASIKEACYYADIDISTYYEWIKKYPKLSDEFERLRERVPLKARQNIVAGIEAGDRSLSQWMLERKKPDEFNPKVKIEHSGSISNPSDSDPADDAILDEAEEKLRQNMHLRIKNKAKPDENTR